MYVPIILANNHKYEKCKYCFFSRYGVLSSALGDSWNFQTNLKLFFCTLRRDRRSPGLVVFKSAHAPQSVGASVRSLYVHKQAYENDNFGTILTNIYGRL